jgi:hypothetical protein
MADNPENESYGDQRELTTHTISLQKKPDPSRPHQSFAAATVAEPVAGAGASGPVAAR